MPETSKTSICVPVCERTLSQLRRAAVEAAGMGEFVELRVDCLDPEVSPYEDLAALADTIKRPLIITLRPIEQGGHSQRDLKYRREFFCRQQSALLDMEYDVVKLLSSDQSNTIDWKNVICSHHDFKGTPADLVQIFERMAATPARILKIAIKADDVIDCIPILKLLEQARREGRDIIAISMGMAGVATRILGPSRGSFLTYASLQDESKTAPGQLTAGDLRRVYRIDGIDSDTQVMGLVGCPVSHSISPHIHNAGFAAAGLNAVFIPLEVHNLNAFIQRMVRPASREIDWRLRGLSVTAPHKSTIMGLLDSVDAAAREIGAVNTILIESDRLHGSNTDALALIQDCRKKAGDLKGANCAVIGAGGAARAAVWGLRSEGADITLFARDIAKGAMVAGQFDVPLRPLANSYFKDFDLVVNATPLGTLGPLENDAIATADRLQGARLAYDLVYNPIETRFLREARRAGCETLGGLGMLVNQAVEQFRLWTGIDPDYRVMHDAARDALA